ncbi:teichoic acid transport system ATP-binding protein [Bacillus sp. 491mf]|uniref:teichoic acids export ABC transporter ATP-binding subunit TagH n=1 Tax=Bacillus TaxID=1386 RepID=UPI0005506A7C|nr:MULTISPECIES: teichoic acids export ABC transporter ATP-binding subunit TagH [unclassified Bacillus (in: firmicutes)]SFD26119.1 teichoic acid transport system ATP-binding protein [Bacillus sp. 491mf]
MNCSVKFRNVTKKYKMHSKNSDKLKDILYPGGFGEDFYALRNLEFEAHKGDVIGIIGVNGSGKSTMSNLIAGITPPTAGSVDIKGKVALIAIAAGLNNQLSGRENIELKCLMMGLSKAKIEKLKPEIIDFADIGKFIDMPVKKYSSGMKSRLGFAISVSINPDVLVIDEALSVGDQTFADKCLKRMNEFKEQGKTIFFVSHSLGQVKSFCTKALWLEYGEVKDYGPIQEVMPKYESFLKEYKAMSKEEQQKFKKEATEKQAGKDFVQTKEASIPFNSLSIANRRKKKKKKISKYVAGFISLALCIAIGGTVYWKKNNVFHSLQAKEKHEEKPIEKKGVPKPKNPLADLDVRYVNTTKARVRSTPILEGEVATTMTFGTSFIVKDQKKDDQSGVNWLKIRYGNGQEGWISEAVVSAIPFSNALPYEGVVNKLKKLDGTSQNLEQYLALLGKSKEDVTSIIGASQSEEKLPEGIMTHYKNVDIICTDQLIVKQVNIKNTNILQSALIEQLGEAQLKSTDNLMLVYRSNKYDFKFSSDGSVINQIAILDMLK